MSGIESVVANGVCVGCGGCEVATSGRIPVRLTTRGQYEADLANASAQDKELGSRACPFSPESRNEDQIADDLFVGTDKDPRLGHYTSMFAGRIEDAGTVEKSSSGGLTTWILNRLLERNEVDAVIHVKDSDNPLFGYVISRTSDEVLGARKSKYFPASFGDVVNSIKGDGLRYAFVGVPCAVRSVRLVTEEDPALAEQLPFLVGIVCGHLKSSAYAESFAWQLGVVPDDIETVDFRIKEPELTSRQYSFGVKSRSSGLWSKEQTLSLFGGNWGHAVFQLDACNYCDDVFAETADVVIGDAWLSKYEIDWRGTNVVVTRNSTIDSLFKEGAANGEFMHENLDVDSVARTQAGNFRHRRDGLAVRLADDDAAGRWRPEKRVEPGYSHVSAERIQLIRDRRELSEVSHTAFAQAKAANDLSIYLDTMNPLIEKYQAGTRLSFGTRLKNKIQRELWKVLRRAAHSAKKMRASK